MKNDRSKIITALTFIALVYVWYFCSLKVNPLFIPSPITVLNDFIELIQSKKLFIDIWYTFKRIFLASGISAIISITMGFMIYNSSFIKAMFHPFLNLLRYIPITAFYPLLILWLGIEEEMKITFYVIATFVYMLPTVVNTLEEINHDLIETGLTIGMNKLQIISRVQLPSSLPSIMNGFITCFGMGFTYCAVCETINAKYGIGYMIQQSSSRGRTDLVFVGILTIMIISFLFDNISKWLVKKIFKWRYINDSIK